MKCLGFLFKNNLQLTMALQLPKDVLNVVECNISSSTPVKECLTYLKGEMSYQSYRYILAQLQHTGDKSAFFDTIGCKKSLFIRFVAVMKILNEEIYNILMDEIRSYCNKKRKSQLLTEYGELIDKEIKKLELHEEEEEGKNTDDTVTTSAPSSTSVSTTTISTIVTYTHPANVQATGATRKLDAVPFTSSPTDSVPVPKSSSSTVHARVLASPASTVQIPPALGSPIRTTSTMSPSIQRNASMPILNPEQPLPYNQGIGKLRGFMIRRLGKVLQDTCTEDGERRLPMWQVLVERGEFPIDYDTEEEIKRSDNQGTKFVGALIESGMTIGQLEQLFLDVRFQAGLDIIRGHPAGQHAMTSPSPGAHSREPPVQFSFGHDISAAGQQQGMPSPRAHSQVRLDQPSFENNTPTAGQHAMTSPSPGAHSREPPVQFSFGHDISAGPASQPPVSDAAVGDDTSLKGLMFAGLVQDPASLFRDNIPERELDSFGNSGSGSLPPPAYAQASDSSSGFARRESCNQQALEGNTPSLDLLIQAEPSKIPFLTHEDGPAATNFAEAATEFEDIQKPIETGNTGIPPIERRPGDDDPPTYSEACVQQNRSSSRASEYYSEEEEQNTEQNDDYHSANE